MNRIFISMIAKLAVMLVFGLGLTHANANLPNAVYSGYWAMSQKVFGEYLVVRFQKQLDGNTLSTIHHFECFDDKSYREVSRSEATLVPTKDGMAVYETGKQRPTSYLKVFHHTPNKKLFLNQIFTDEMSGLKQLFPDNMILLYYPTQKLEPTCDTEPRPAQ